MATYKKTITTTVLTADRTITFPDANLNFTPSTGWAVTNVSADKVFDADSTSTAELADVLGTLITALIAQGTLGA